MSRLTIANIRSACIQLDNALPEDYRDDPMPHEQCAVCEEIFVGDELDWCEEVNGHVCMDCLEESNLSGER